MWIVFGIIIVVRVLIIVFIPKESKAKREKRVNRSIMAFKMKEEINPN